MSDDTNNDTPPLLAVSNVSTLRRRDDVTIHEARQVLYEVVAIAQLLKHMHENREAIEPDDLGRIIVRLTNRALTFVNELPDDTAY